MRSHREAQQRVGSRSLIAIVLVIASALLFIGCGRQELPSQTSARDSVPAASSPVTSPVNNPDHYIETGDLDAIKKRGIIRFVNLSGPSGENLLPRDSIVTLRNFELANKLAEKLKLKPL